MTKDEIRERLVAISNLIQEVSPLAARIQTALGDLWRELESEPEPLAVVEGYVRREHMKRIRKAGLAPWILTIPIQQSKEGFPVTVTITKRKVKNHDAL